MPRYFTPISIEDLQQKIDDACQRPKDIVDIVSKDIKVDFDLENFHTSFGPKNKSIMGAHTLENGLTFVGYCAGGDWETPIFFIVYWDNKLRGYIPTLGNPWNTTTKEAYGNDEDADLANAKKRYPEKIDHDEEDGDYFEADFDFEPEKIIQDILTRIQPRT